MWGRWDSWPPAANQLATPTKEASWEALNQKKEDARTCSCRQSYKG